MTVRIQVDRTMAVASVDRTGSGGASRRRNQRSRAGLSLPSCVLSLLLLVVVASLPSSSSAGARWPARTTLSADRSINASPAWAEPDYTLYHTAAHILARAKSVAKAHPLTVRRAVARAYDGDYGANVTVLVVEPGGLRKPPPLTDAMAEQRAAVADEVRRRASDGKPPMPATEVVAAAASGGGNASSSAVPSGVYVPPLRSDDDRVRVLMDFGQHGREFITSEVGLRLLEVLAATGSDAADRAAADAALASAAGVSVGSPRLRRLRAVLDRLSLVILPLENEGGRARVESGMRCERKNGRGVDPNRNWPVDWGKKERDYDPGEEFPGRAPGSEPETRVVRALADQLRPHAWVNVHSGMQALFTAYDHVARVPQGPGARAALALLSRLNSRACEGKCAVGSGGKSVGYLAHGTATDHMYAFGEGVPLAFTWEIYGDEGADFDDCFRMFNPLTKAAFDRVVAAWVKASLSALELLPTHPAVAPLFESSSSSSPSSEREDAASPPPPSLFAVDPAEEPEEAAEAAEAELQAAALQAESARAEEKEKEKERKQRKGRGSLGGGGDDSAGGGGSSEDGAAVVAGEAEAEVEAAEAPGSDSSEDSSSGSGTATAAAPSSSPSPSPALPRRMGPQRQQLLVGPGGGNGTGGGGGATGALGIAAAGAGARLFAVLPMLVVCAAVAAVGVAALARRRRAAAGGGGYAPAADLDDGGFGFGPVAAAPSSSVGRARPAGVSLVGVVGRRP